MFVNRFYIVLSHEMIFFDFFLKMPSIEQRQRNRSVNNNVCHVIVNCKCLMTNTNYVQPVWLTGLPNFCLNRIERHKGYGTFSQRRTIFQIMSHFISYNIGIFHRVSLTLNGCCDLFLFSIGLILRLKVTFRCDLQNRQKPIRYA